MGSDFAGGGGGAVGERWGEGGRGGVMVKASAL